MRNASDYLSYIKSLIVSNSQVAHWAVIREEAQGDEGLFRYRLWLQGGGLLEMVERFQIVESQAQVNMYAFHWQNADGLLIKRWDNAAHHPEIGTHPHHVHEGTDERVLPHGLISAEDVLALVARA